MQLRRQNFPIRTFSSKKCDLLFRTSTPSTPSQQTNCTAALFSTFFRPKIRWDISYALPLVPIICCLARSPDHVQVNSRRLQGLKKHLVILRSQGLDLEIDTIIGRSHHHPPIHPLNFSGSNNTVFENKEMFFFVHDLNNISVNIREGYNLVWSPLPSSKLQLWKFISSSFWVII